MHIYMYYIPVEIIHALFSDMVHSQLTAIVCDKVWVHSRVEHLLNLLYRALHHLLHKLAVVGLLHTQFNVSQYYNYTY